MRKKNKKPFRRKIVRRLPDLDHSKNAVLNSLSSANSRRNYKFAMEQFITWYCSEPRLSLNRAVVLRFRLYLESLGLAAGTINQRLAAARRLAYEAADSGLLSPELAAGIRRVKGVKQLGSRAGNWLTRDQARMLLETADGGDLRSLRDLAMISVLLGENCAKSWRVYWITSRPTARFNWLAEVTSSLRANAAWLHLRPPPGSPST